MLDAMRDMVGENFFLRATQGGAHRRKLRDDIDALALPLDHAREPAHLAFNAFEALQHRRLGIRSHAGYIPLRGNRFKRICRAASGAVA